MHFDPVFNSNKNAPPPVRCSRADAGRVHLKLPNGIHRRLHLPDVTYARGISRSAVDEHFLGIRLRAANLSLVVAARDGRRNRKGKCGDITPLVGCQRKRTYLFARHICSQLGIDLEQRSSRNGHSLRLRPHLQLYVDLCRLLHLDGYTLPHKSRKTRFAVGDVEGRNRKIQEVVDASGIGDGSISLPGGRIDCIHLGAADYSAGSVPDNSVDGPSINLGLEGH